MWLLGDDESAPASDGESESKGKETAAAAQGESKGKETAAAQGTARQGQGQKPQGTARQPAGANRPQDLANMTTAQINALWDNGDIHRMFGQAAPAQKAGKE